MVDAVRDSQRREFWEHVRDGGKRFPADIDRRIVLADLFSHLGDPDPLWREEVAFPLLAQWIFKRGLRDDERGLLAKDAIAGLRVGLGTKENDSVFLRSYSTLVLCAIVERDLKHAFLRPLDFRRILASALRLLDREEDIRGFVPGKGWAHTLAHLADLFDALAKSPHTRRQDLQRMLRSVAKKLCKPTSTVLGYGEPVRLAKAVITILDRGLVPKPFIRSWIDSLSRSAEGRSWSQVDDRSESVNARTNVTLFLAALSILAPSRKAISAQLARKVLWQMAEKY